VRVEVLGGRTEVIGFSRFFQFVQVYIQKEVVPIELVQLQRADRRLAILYLVVFIIHQLKVSFLALLDPLESLLLVQVDLLVVLLQEDLDVLGTHIYLQLLYGQPIDHDLSTVVDLLQILHNLHVVFSEELAFLG